MNPKIIGNFAVQQVLQANIKEQGKSEGFDSCDRPNNLAQIGFKSSIFRCVWPSNLMMTLQNNRVSVLCYVKLCSLFQSHQWIQTGVTARKRSIRVKIDDFFAPCELQIWRMTLQNNRAPVVCYFKHCVSFHRHWWIQTGVTVRKRHIRIKIEDFLSRATLKFDRWPCKTIEHL